MKILVIGDSCTDVFIYGRCERLNPEAPIPVFEPSKTVTNDGMAGNVVANLRKLGVEKVELVTNHEQITKTRYVEYKSNQMLLRVDSNDSVTNSFDIKKVDFDSYDAVVVADYDKGFLTNNDINEIGLHSKLSFIDTKKVIDLNNFKGYTFVKMNEVEWERCQRYGAEYEDWKDNLIVTMSERGCMYNGKSYSVDNSVEVRDLSGAGDTWMASFAFKFVETNDVDLSIEFANKNATLVVQKRGVTTI
jgi:bifunctional ADP-heptose synthase (sugar kinase/adenylyltransferase)